MQTLDVETSRARLQRAVAGATDVTLIRNPGNIGDHLIHAGTRRVLAGITYREVSLLRLQGLRGELAVITGGGGWCHAHRHMPEYLPGIERKFERVVVFPSSFDTTEKRVRRVLARTNALVFARERISYEQIRDLCNADLAHDCAAFFDYTRYRRKSQWLLLTAYRTDKEAAGRPIPKGNNDISLTCESLDEFLWTISGHEIIETDRAHVMLAAAMLGKRVYYNSSNYHKVPAIAEFSLAGYPLIRLEENRAPVLAECCGRDASAYEQLPRADRSSLRHGLQMTSSGSATDDSRQQAMEDMKLIGRLFRQAPLRFRNYLKRFLRARV